MGQPSGRGVYPSGRVCSAGWVPRVQQGGHRRKDDGSEKEGFEVADDEPRGSDQEALGSLFVTSRTSAKEDGMGRARMRDAPSFFWYN